MVSCCLGVQHGFLQLPWVEIPRRLAGVHTGLEPVLKQEQDFRALFFFRCSDGWRWGQWCWVSAEVVLPALLLTPWADSGLMGLLASYLSSAAGFEGCSMVPSIYPLETLHNSLSLKQVSEFLTSVCQNAGDPHTRTTRGKTHKPTHSCLYL